MAGGWGHVTNDDGTPYEGRYGMGDLLENGGDVNEFAEEAYGMVWWLAAHRARLRYATTEPTREQILDVIESARENYRDGVRLGRGS